MVWTLNGVEPRGTILVANRSNGVGVDLIIKVVFQVARLLTLESQACSLTNHGVETSSASPRVHFSMDI